ncbi:hypothetical protein KWI12_19685 [Citrobacter cronae]|uniref:hypothetical protein n=1 Tax=Citrobacter cronae TaxID=1748967 RepID=UPI0021CDFF94|nr:hypothetical protein [Citrobacter cronae]MCU6199080.1 hypothetical protein [Citrobacter cronae]
MDQKPCPACMQLSDCISGETPGYLRFTCISHGVFEIHERIANHLILPDKTPQRLELSFKISERRKTSPDEIIKITTRPSVSSVSK